MHVFLCVNFPFGKFDPYAIHFLNHLSDVLRTDYFPDHLCVVSDLLCKTKEILQAEQTFAAAQSFKMNSPRSNTGSTFKQ